MTQITAPSHRSFREYILFQTSQNVVGKETASYDKDTEIANEGRIGYPHRKIDFSCYKSKWTTAWVYQLMPSNVAPICWPFQHKPPNDQNREDNNPATIVQNNATQNDDKLKGNRIQMAIDIQRTQKICKRIYQENENSGANIKKVWWSGKKQAFDEPQVVVRFTMEKALSNTANWSKKR